MFIESNTLKQWIKKNMRLNELISIKTISPFVVLIQSLKSNGKQIHFIEKSRIHLKYFKYYFKMNTFFSYYVQSV